MDNFDERTSEILRGKALVEQFDLIAHIVDGHYKVVIGEPKTDDAGNIFPTEREGSYDQYLEDKIFPVLAGTYKDQKNSRAALTLERVERALMIREPYEVNIICHVGGEIRYKRFVFYLADSAEKFFIMLQSDTTKLQKIQLVRNAQLKAALDTAHAANVAKNSFLSNISHEVRTPLNAIVGFNKIALNENLSEKVRDCLEKIDKSAQQLLCLINDVLDMSRIESGRMSVRHEEFSFTQMLEEINAIIGEMCADKKLIYECKIADEFREFYIGDAVKLKQSLLNILSNAVKFTPVHGTVTFIVAKVSELDQRTNFKFVVKDTGIGIAPEFLPKIFDVFSQAEDASADVYGGTGLGLPITKNIVEMMNGKISVQSEKGKGTEFVVNVALKSSDRNSESEPAATKNLADLGGKKILLAEDIPINAEIMRELLKMRGIETDCAENGKIVLEKFEKSAPNFYDAILMDVRMPIMDGLQATTEIRALDRADAKKIPIIALTANAFEEDVQLSLQAGMNAHLTKPVEPDKLYQTLQELIKVD